MTSDNKMKLRSDKVTVGAMNTGARALWRATGTLKEEFGRPIIGIANSFTEMLRARIIYGRYVGILPRNSARRRCYQ